MKTAYAKYFSSLILFGSNGILASFVPLSSVQITMMRTLFGSLILLVILFVIRSKPFNKASKKDVVLILISGLFMGASWIFQYEAFIHIGIGTTSLIYCLGPILLIVVSPLIFKEKLTLMRIAFFAIALSGIVLINIEMSSLEGNVFGLFCALMCALCYTAFIILNKHAKMRGLKNSFLQLFGALLISTIICFTLGELPFTIPTESLTPLLILGFINTGLGCYLYFSGIGSLSAQSVAVCDYLEPLLAIVLSAIILHESLSVLQIFGGLLIVVGALGSELFTTGNKRFATKPKT